MMVSVERVTAYSKLESEGELHVQGDVSKRKEWPEHGKIEAKDVVCTYRKGLQPVLRGISFTILPGQVYSVI
jgi:ATP-binding cassette subfamily C (CFTR/MRP) protein 1